MGDPGEIVGPWRTTRIGTWDAPFYMIPFDEAGGCTGPRTTAHLVDALSNQQITHVILFSHGWNNNWASATEWYERFVDGLVAVRARYPDGAEFRPVFVGVFWPSIVLDAPGERAPRIAGGAPDQVAEDWPEQLRTVATTVDPDQRERFEVLAGKDGLDPDELGELAKMLCPVWAGTHAVDELAENPGLDPDELVAIWHDLAKRSPAPADPNPSGAPRGTPPPGPFAGNGAAAPDRAPASAGLLKVLDPRNLVRLTTVLMMKDRAGRVGATGVAALLGEIQGATSRPVHLVGHSYGGKVVLSAVCRMPVEAHPVESVLLLQPAMSYLCFAARVPGLNTPGGYRPALGRVRQPVLSTFSAKDVPLTWMFHLAVRRDSDLGEALIAAAPPSRYAALGGYGPPENPPEVEIVQARAPGAHYPRERDRELLGVQASDVIGGHGEINNDATWWMLADQVRRAAEAG